MKWKEKLSTDIEEVLEAAEDKTGIRR